jgi:ankyrin repeat protein
MSNDYLGSLLSLKSSTALKAKPGGKDMDDYTAPTKKIFDDDAGSALTLFAETTSNLPLDEESTSDTLCDVESTIMERDRTDIRLPKEVIQAIKSGSLPLVESLLDQALLNAQDCNGRTPLSFAAEIGHVMIAKLLLIRGASVSIRQYSIHSAQGMSNPYKYSGRTPLHWAAEKGHLEVVHLLLQYGANPNARSTIGRFPLLDATMNNHLDVAKLLIEYNADINASSFYVSFWFYS